MRHALLSLLLLAAPHAACALQFVREAGLLTATGVITMGDTDRLRAALRGVPVDAPLAGLSLNSPGGDLDEGLALAALTHEVRLPTYVADRAVCASACFLVWAAGARVYASSAALLGVHSAAAQDGDTPAAQAATVRMARRLAQYGVPEPVLGKLIATAPSRVWWLGRADLESMHATLDVMPATPVAIIAPASGPPGAVSKPGYRVEPAARGWRVETPAAGYTIGR